MTAKSITNLILLIIFLSMAGYSIFCAKKNRKLKYDLANYNDGKMAENDTLIQKIDSVVNIIYIDSTVYSNDIAKIITENEKLKTKIWENRNNEKYKNLHRWLSDSLEYYSIFRSTD